MKSFIALSGALVVLAIVSRQAEAGYDQINKYLVEKVTTPDVDQNVNAAVEWLKEEEVAKHSIFSKNLVPDLKKFITLKQILDNPKCDRSDYEILRTNEEAVGSHSLDDERKVIRRVDTVLLQIFKNHADKCQNVYPDVYKTKKGQFDATALKRVSVLGKTVIRNVGIMRSSYDEVVNPDELFELIISSSNDYTGVENIYRYALLESAKDDPNVKYASKVPDENTGKLVVHKDKIKELVSDYFIDPCKQYVDTFGPDLFVPARFDSRFHLEFGLAEQDYYDGWEYFDICRGLLSKYPATIVHDIMKSAEGSY